MTTGGIAVVTEATFIAPKLIEAFCHVAAERERRHVAPAWSRLPCPGIFFSDPKKVPADMGVVVVRDEPSDPAALGWHSIFGGRVIGEVAVRAILDAGGTEFVGPTSVSCVLMHELDEPARDPFCNVWVDAPDGWSWAFEIDDPVQGDSYPFDGFTCPNFVRPAFFNAGATSGFDFLGLVQSPFSVRPEGYAELRNAATGESRQIGMRPAWKSGLRSARRLRSTLGKSLESK